MPEIFCYLLKNLLHNLGEHLWSSILVMAFRILFGDSYTCMLESSEEGTRTFLSYLSLVDYYKFNLSL